MENTEDPLRILVITTPALMEHIPHIKRKRVICYRVHKYIYGRQLCPELLFNHNSFVLLRDISLLPNKVQKLKMVAFRLATPKITTWNLFLGKTLTPGTMSWIKKKGSDSWCFHYQIYTTVIARKQPNNMSKYAGYGLPPTFAPKADILYIYI